MRLWVRTNVVGIVVLPTVQFQAYRPSVTLGIPGYDVHWLLWLFQAHVDKAWKTSLALTPSLSAALELDGCPSVPPSPSGRLEELHQCPPATGEL